jgi:hypothetical protein
MQVPVSLLRGRGRADEINQQRGQQQRDDLRCARMIYCRTSTRSRAARATHSVALPANNVAYGPRYRVQAIRNRDDSIADFAGLNRPTVRAQRADPGAVLPPRPEPGRSSARAPPFPVAAQLDSGDWSRRAGTSAPRGPQA